MKNYIKPWNEESCRMLKQLSKNGRAYTHDMKFVREFSKRKTIREAADRDFFDIAHNRRKGKTWFVLSPNVSLKPIQRGRFFEWQKKF